MIPAILAAAGRMLASRGGAAIAGRAATAMAGAAPSMMSATQLVQAQSAARSSAIGGAIRGGLTPKQAMKLGSMAEQNVLKEQVSAQKRYAKDLDNNFKYVQDGFKHLGSAAQTLGHELTNPIDAMTKSMSPFVAKLQEMAPVVAKFNPGAANQFAIAANNFEAAIGKIMTPALQGGTRMIDRFNSVLSGLEPVLRPASQALGKMFDDIGKFYQEVGPNLATFWGTMGDAFIGFTKLVSLSLKTLGDAAKGFNIIVQRLGLAPSNAGQRYDPKAFTRAVGGVGMAGGSADIYNPAAQAAIQASSGIGNKQSPEEQTVTVLDNIYDLLRGVFGPGGKGGVAAAGVNAAMGNKPDNSSSNASEGPGISIPSWISPLGWLATR